MMGKRCNLRTICGECGIQGAVLKNEVIVVEMAWKPPRPAHLAMGDEWICPGCGRTWIEGFGVDMFSSHNENDFIERLRKYATEEPERLRVLWENISSHDEWGDGLEYLVKWLEGVKDGDKIVVESTIVQDEPGKIELVAKVTIKKGENVK